MKILLINPPVKNTISLEMPLFVRQNEGLFPPMGLMYLASSLRNNIDCDVRVLDMAVEDMDEDGFRRYVNFFCPDVAGIGIYTHNLIDAIGVADELKKINKNIHVCAGGPHVAIFPEETINISSIDSAIAGEGEKIFSELVKGIRDGRALGEISNIFFKNNGRVFKTETEKGLPDVNRLPFPDRTVVNNKKYFSILGRGGLSATIISSRGCPYRCSFCSTPRGYYRARSPGNVVDEMEKCLEAGIKEMHFIDDTFNADPDRAVKICDEIKRRRLKVSWSFRGRIDKITENLLKAAKQAGCYRVHLGVETSSDEGLALLKKDITVKQIRDVFALTKKAGIATVAYFMIGCPHEKNRNDVMKTIEFSREIDPDFALFNILTPYPSTELYENALERGVIKNDYWKDFAANPKKDFKPRYWEEWLERDDLTALLDLAYKKFYLRLEMIFRFFAYAGNPGFLLKKLGAGFKICVLLLKEKECLLCSKKKEPDL